MNTVEFNAMVARMEAYSQKLLAEKWEAKRLGKPWPLCNICGIQIDSCVCHPGAEMFTAHVSYNLKNTKL